MDDSIHGIKTSEDHHGKEKREEGGEKTEDRIAKRAERSEKRQERREKKDERSKMTEDDGKMTEDDGWANHKPRSHLGPRLESRKHWFASPILCNLPGSSTPALFHTRRYSACQDSHGLRHAGLRQTNRNVARQS